MGIGKGASEAAALTATVKTASNADPRRYGQGRLRTYVSPEGLEEDQESDAEGGWARSAVDQAGVGRVLVYERQRQRHPREMPPKHPGYDIESSNDAGVILRYIEVKSLSGDWGSLGAALTDTQFGNATGRVGDRYWLYVVARAEQDDYRIYRVQTPHAR